LPPAGMLGITEEVNEAELASYRTGPGRPTAGTANWGLTLAMNIPLRQLICFKAPESPFSAGSG